jgi:AcrR family transcriptional regulator
VRFWQDENRHAASDPVLGEPAIALGASICETSAVVKHSPADADLPSDEGLRERKRRQTRQRIAEAGLQLFIADGYEATTLDAIAAEAGISRRTFFYYFKSKEEILQAAQATGFLEALRTAFAGQSAEQAPFDAVRRALPKLVSRFETKESIVVDRLMRSTETLRAHKQAVFVQMEELLFEALRDVWSGAESEPTLRLVAMVSIGVMRLAMDAWRHDRAKRPLAGYVREGFAKLKSQI